MAKSQQNTFATRLNRRYNRMIIVLASNGKSDSEISSIMTLEAKGKVFQSRVNYWTRKLKLANERTKSGDTLVNRTQCKETEFLLTN